MHEINDLISNKSNGKYSFLQLFECVFNEINNECTLVFLFPENKNEMTEDERKEIFDLLTNELGLNSKLVVKYKKSFLDIDIIRRQTLAIMKEKYPSISANLSLEDIIIQRTDNEIVVRFLLEKNIYNFFVSQDLTTIISNMLKEYFIAKIIVIAQKDSSKEIANDIITKLEEKVIIEYNPFPERKIERYNVSDIAMLFGTQIETRPEYIRNNKEVKSSVIFSGVVSFFQKRTYVKKKEKAKGALAKESNYYTFLLDDGSGKIGVTYFCPKANVKSMDKIVDGTRIIALGDIQKYGEKLTYYIKSMGLCELAKNPEPIKKNDESDNQAIKPITHYQLCHPKPYTESSQANLFEKPPVYTDYIMNNKFVIYDFETTSLSAEEGEIIEIGGVTIENGKIVNCFQSFIKPKTPISNFTTHLTGITNDMLIDAPNAKVVIEDFYLYCQGAIMGGYNNIRFDNLFLQALSSKHNIVFDNSQIDVMNIAISKLTLKKYSLASVVEHLGIVLVDAHRALNDALATAKAFLKLGEIN